MLSVLENAREFDLTCKFTNQSGKTFTWIPSGLGLQTDSNKLTLHLAERMGEFPEPQLSAANILAWQMSLKEDGSNSAHPDQYVERLRKPLNIERDAPTARAPVSELTKNEFLALSPEEKLLSLAMNDIKTGGQLAQNTEELLHQYVFGKSNSAGTFTDNTVIEHALHMASDASLLDRTKGFLMNAMFK